MKSSRRTKWIVGSFVAPAVLIVLLIVARAILDVWGEVTLPDDAPRIAMSLEDTWLNDLGITTSTYEQAMIRAGGRLVALKPDGDGRTVTPERARSLLGTADALLLTGGGDVDPALYGGDTTEALMVDRKRDDFEIALIGAARQRGLPILGICRGCQILNVARGGTLRSLRSHTTLAKAHFGLAGHAVDIEPESTIAAVLGTTRLEDVESFHGQAVDRPGQDVRVVARSEDGVIEAVEIGPKEAWIIGVQWHPELDLLDSRQLEIFGELVRQAARRKDAR